MILKEILFKGKRLDNGDWVEGVPVAVPRGLKATMVCHPRIGEDDEIFVDCIHIDHKTVCQYTGENDKNGVKIFEGDRLCISKGEPYEEIGKARYVNGCFIIEYSDSWDFLDNVKCVSEIVGNIHDKE